jgi:hypothetical protein
MATLSITVGAITESVSLPDDKAQVLLAYYLEQAKGDAVGGTARQQLRAVVLALAAHIRHRAGMQIQMQREQEARDAASVDEIALGDWA